jgi:hypothetical protein
MRKCSIVHTPALVTVTTTCQRHAPALLAVMTNFQKRISGHLLGRIGVLSGFWVDYPLLAPC